MINPPGLQEAVARLSPQGALAPPLPDDVWRVQQAYHGAVAWPLCEAMGDGPLAVYLGARSGLEAVLARLRSPATEIVVVEPDAARRSALRRVLSTCGPGATQICQSVEQAQRAVGDRPIAFLRFDRASFAPATAAALLGHRRCGHLCGTFRADVDDPLSLYRDSRDRFARSFFWRDERSSMAFGGDGGPVEIEVSVIVPAYNVEDKIDDCVASLAEQKLRKLEVIVVDDGSRDDTGRRLDRWAERYPERIRVIHKANGGCASARMAGLAVARGEFVAFTDGDDWVDPSMYEELYRAAALRGAEIAQCGYMEVFPDGTHVAHEDASGGDGPEGRTGLVGRVIDHLVVRPTIWRRIYRRDFLRDNDIRFPEHIRRYDDLPFQFEALARARRMTVIPDPYYFYRQHPAQDIAVRDERLYVMFELLDWLRDRVMTWADRSVEKKLLTVELNSHVWALERLKPRLRGDYRRRARQQLLHGRVHLGQAHILWLALRHGPPGFRLVARAIASEMLRSLPARGVRRAGSTPAASAQDGTVAAGSAKPPA